MSALLGALKKTDGTVRASPDKEVKLAMPRSKKPERRGPDGRPRSDPATDTRGLDPELVEAVGQVAEMKSTEDGRKKTESQLLRKLKFISKVSKEAQVEDSVAGEEASSLALGDLVSNLKIDSRPRLERVPLEDDAKGMRDDMRERRRGANDAIRAKQDRKKELTMEQLAFLQKRQKLRRQETAKSETYVPTDIFGGTPLGIFTSPSVTLEEEDQQQLKMWRNCHERQLRILSTPSPRNALEEMILWTEQGKLWHFPVDNEQGLDYSEDPFHSHVFLEHLLEPWCPKGGPIRHFMELVCNGLSKNPFVTSAKKRDTIDWFQSYFEREENKEILIHAGFWMEDQAASN